MKGWARIQLGVEVERRTGTLVVLDPLQLLEPDDIAESVFARPVSEVSDWIGLRRVWDGEVRTSESIGQVIVVRDGSMRSAGDLPWDVEHEALNVVRISSPVPAELRDAFAQSPRWRDRLAASSAGGRPWRDVVASALEFMPGSPSSELELVARLRTDPTTAPALWLAVSQIVATQPALDIARANGDMTPLQQAWNEWLDIGSVSRFAVVLGQSPSAVLQLLAAGLLEPAPLQAEGLPTWTEIGAFDPDPSELAQELLDHQPSMPNDFEGWVSVASWWGQVRAAVTSQPLESDTTERAWQVWEEVDSAFRSWLLESYGRELLSAASPPRSVNRIAGFLSHRVEGGARVVLVLLDGMGFAQWHTIRANTPIKTEASSGCLAMIPTLTTNSRQAVFAGKLPAEFSESVDEVKEEQRRWREFWAEHGIADRDVSFVNTKGADASDVPDLKGRVVGIVVRAIDEIMHGAEVLGDRQVTTAVQLWSLAGFLESLISRGIAEGYEVWLTADHGNLQAMPAEKGTVPNEGLVVEDGTRVRRYSSSLIRDQAGFGIAWDPPGFPAEGRAPLFAAGRSGFHRSGIRVSHGGLSLDEVIVPLVRVTL